MEQYSERLAPRGRRFAVARGTKPAAVRNAAAGAAIAALLLLATPALSLRAEAAGPVEVARPASMVVPTDAFVPVERMPQARRGQFPPNRDFQPSLEGFHDSLMETLEALPRPALTERFAPRTEEPKVGLIQENPASTLTGVQNLTRGRIVSAALAAESKPRPEPVETPQAARPPSSAGYAQIQDRPITSLTTDIGCPPGARPADMSEGKFSRRPAEELTVFAERGWPGLLYQWEAPGLCHGPLYFEEENLERYGYAHRRNLVFQPVISGGRFFATVVAMPYMLTLRPPCECVYTLGYYRPGSCVPFQARLMELNAKAAAVQGAAVTGLIFAIP